MRNKLRLGLIIGGISIAFSTLCFLVTPAFTPAFMVAVVFGLPSGAVALAFKARRTAIVALVFALMPCAFLFPERIGLTLMGVGFLLSVWVLVDYLRSRRAVVSASA